MQARHLSICYDSQVIVVNITRGRILEIDIALTAQVIEFKTA